MKEPIMAKDKGKKDKAAKADTKEEKAAKSPEFKFGVAELAEALGIEPASVRVQLRNRKVEKAGKSYGWNTQKDFDAVVKSLKADKPKGEGKSKGKKGDDAGAADAADGKKSKKDKKNKKSKKD
jgi:hypothetical protein